MAVLPSGEIDALSREFQSDASRERVQFGALTKADLRAAIVAVDAWLETNAAAFNAAIPQPARAQLTTKQKARLLIYVVQRRHGQVP